jgi:UDP-N-acetylmuramoylalanine--D-glutamate ligase
VQEKIPLVIGFGVTGKSIINYLAASHTEIFLIEEWEENPSLEEIKDIELKVHLNPDINDELFQNISRIYSSPGVSSKHEIFSHAKKHNIKVSSDIEEYLTVQEGVKVLVTGTNGKTSTCLLLETLFKSVFPSLKISVLGNIGKPVLPHIKDDIDISIIEVSSFQLELLNEIEFDIGLLLNIEQDHMDRYLSYQDYKNIKFLVLKYALFKISYDDTGSRLSNPLNYKDMNIPQAVLELPTFKDWPMHDIENLRASLAVLKCYYENFDNSSFDELNLAKTLERAFMDFRKPPHRFEIIENSIGINFINDSKATNLDAMLKAIQAVNELKKDQESISLICGGDLKEQDTNLTSLKSVSSVSRVLIYGKDKEILFESMRQYTECLLVNDLEEAVMEAKKYSKEGDYVMLSPACSSLDMFINYQERGDKFKRLIEDL